jgi:GT2 family glycosyltransferase
VIVTWNSAKDIGPCLSSLGDQGLDLQIVVVDNASTDGTVQIVREFTDVQLVQNGANVGFAAGCNQGADLCQAPWLLLLNPDTVVPPGTIKTWVQEAQQTPGLGATGPKLLNVDQTLQPSVRSLPTVGVAIVLLLKLHRIFPKLISQYQMRGFDYSQPRVVPQVMGAALLTPASVYRRLGGFDGSYHLWFEEVDYCTRLASVGLRVWYMPIAEITHAGGSSFVQTTSLWRQWQFTSSLLKYSNRYFGWRSSLVYLAAPISLALALITSVVPRALLKRASRTWYSS